MFYNFKNLKICLNGRFMFANDASLSLQNNLEPLFTNPNKHASSYGPTTALEGNLKISYYITGEDVLKNFISDENTTITGNFGGLYFNSGYLKDYELTVIPYNPVQVNSNIVFYEPIKGAISPTNEKAVPVTILNTIDVGLNNQNIGNSAEITSASYSFSNEIIPLYTTENVTGRNVITPTAVYQGRKQILSTVELSTGNFDLHLTGNYATLTINLNDQNNQLLESYSTVGTLTKKELRSSYKNLVQTAISLRQDSTLLEPTISGFTPLSGITGSLVTITGANLTNLIQINFYDKIVNTYTSVNNSTISATVPAKTITGPISVTTFGGAVRSSGSFTVTGQGITII